jgi:hypothetical protein
MIRASLSCWASSRRNTLDASLSPAVFAAREKSAAALRCSSAASSQCIFSVSWAALRAWLCAWIESDEWTCVRYIDVGTHAVDRGDVGHGGIAMGVCGGRGKCMSECHFRAIGSLYGCSCCAMQGVTLSQSCDLVVTGSTWIWRA